MGKRLFGEINWDDAAHVSSSMVALSGGGGDRAGQSSISPGSSDIDWNQAASVTAPGSSGGFESQAVHPDQQLIKFPEIDWNQTAVQQLGGDGSIGGAQSAAGCTSCQGQGGDPVDWSKAAYGGDPGTTGAASSTGCKSCSCSTKTPGQSCSCQSDGSPKWVDMEMSRSGPRPFGLRGPTGPTYRRLPNEPGAIITLAERLSGRSFSGWDRSQMLSKLATGADPKRRADSDPSDPSTFDPGQGWDGKPSGGSHADEVPASCTVLPLEVRPWWTFTLRNVCQIDLGNSEYFASVSPFFGRLTATLPTDFQPTSSHEEFLRALLPQWTDRMDDLGWDTVWDAATRVPTQASFNNLSKWSVGGLFWDSGLSEGFFWRSFRYATALLYSYAGAVEKIDAFKDACKISKKEIRQKLSNGPYYVQMEEHIDDGTNMVSLSATGRVSARRSWTAMEAGFVHKQRDYAAVTPFAIGSNFSDSWQVNSALADYFFWWSIRLYDYLKAGNAADLDEVIRCTIMSSLCAKSALSEIADISATMLHEIAHTTDFPSSEFECATHGQKFNCCRYNLGWVFLHRVYAVHALPLSTLPDVATFVEYPVQTSTGAEVTDGNFNIPPGESWSFQFGAESSDPEAQNCIPLHMKGVHESLWTLGHPVTVSWEFPSDCASGSFAGSKTLT